MACQHIRSRTRKEPLQSPGIITYTENGIVHAHDDKAEESNAKAEYVGPRLVPFFPRSVLGIIRRMAAAFLVLGLLGKVLGPLDVCRAPAMSLGSGSLLLPTRSRINRAKHGWIRETGYPGDRQADSVDVGTNAGLGDSLYSHARGP